MNIMDSTLSEFIAHTGAEPGLARDILEGEGPKVVSFYF